jgi:hypothetical protein
MPVIISLGLTLMEGAKVGQVDAAQSIKNIPQQYRNVMS